ncbi:MAG: hypothetical protein IPJ71_19150 [Bdellovibrionales bacterium]|nr:hypothetical protein [Bdellovibrionales bacterium]
MARFFQDDQIYEKELAFKNLNGYALFEDDIVLGKIDDLRSKPLNFVLPSAKREFLILINSVEFSPLPLLLRADDFGQKVSCPM